MSDNVKIALIVVVGVLIGLSAYLYFTPFQQCVRALDNGRHDQNVVACVQATHQRGT